MVILYLQQPELSSLALIKNIKDNYPLALRIVISGFENEELVMRVLGNNLAKLFLMNTINEDSLINLVRHLFEVEDILKNKSLLLAINSVEDLPVLENVYYSVSNLIRKNADVNKIAKAIEEDQSIAIKVLHIANSAFYGIKTASIKTAINYLGLSNIKNIILATSAFEYLKDSEFKYEKELLWNHANNTNKIATQIYKNMLKKEMSDTFAVSGLLHDIGKLVLLKNYPNEYREILRIAGNGSNVYDIEVEKRFLSVSHEEIGGYLLNWWELPHPIIEAALFHHDPLNCAVINKELTSVIYIANYYSRIRISGKEAQDVDKKVFDFLGINKEDCDKFFI
jgi:HD-like signal output (HDOD) protein